jgi:hypothetical protein
MVAAVSNKWASRPSESSRFGKYKLSKSIYMTRNQAGGSVRGDLGAPMDVPSSSPKAKPDVQSLSSTSLGRGRLREGIGVQPAGDRGRYGFRVARLEYGDAPECRLVGESARTPEGNSEWHPTPDGSGP